MSNILRITFTNSHLHYPHCILIAIWEKTLSHYVRCTCAIPSFAFHLSSLFSHQCAHLLCVLCSN